MATVSADWQPDLGQDVLMRCISSDGTVTVETIRLSGTKGPDGAWLRVKHGRYHVADVRTVDELSKLDVDLADLSEPDSTRRRLQARVSANSRLSLTHSSYFVAVLLQLSCDAVDSERHFYGNCLEFADNIFDCES
jgi:hypothetical protein